MGEAPYKIAFAGFRHGHIFDLYSLAGASARARSGSCMRGARGDARRNPRKGHRRNHPMTGLSRCSTRWTAISSQPAPISPVAARCSSKRSHAANTSSATNPCVLGWPTSNRIEALAREKNLKVGCMLTMRDAAPVIGARNLIQAGRIGEVHAIAFGGQHPLLLGSRPGWYFEQGKHGGTIADIGIHAIDALPWVTGHQWSKIQLRSLLEGFCPRGSPLGGCGADDAGDGQRLRGFGRCVVLRS